MFPTFIGILDIQSWWEVPSIAHFCSLFRDAFNLLDFDIEDLEEALLSDNETDDHLLQELIVRLLEGCLPNDTKNDISTFNYQMFLRRLFRKKCQEYKCENPFNTDVDFELLPLRQKVKILRALCDFRLDAENVEQSLNNLDANCLRVEPLGHDRKNSAYWYFYGTRLYREDYVNNFNSTIQKSRSKSKDKKRKKQRNRVVKEKAKEEETEEISFDESEQVNEKRIWQVVCFTQQDWSRLVDKLETSEYDTERKLFRTLSENFMPEIPKLFDLKEKQQRHKLLLRSNSRTLRSNESDHLLKPAINSESKSFFQPKMNKMKVKSKAGKGFKKNKIHNLKNANIGENLCLPVSVLPIQKKGRQTNNSLASAVGQIVIDTADQLADELHKKGNINVSEHHCSSGYNNSSFVIEDEERRVGMFKVLECVKDHDEAWPFIDPVEEEYAPRYYSVVRRPMDLSKMEEKLENGCYKNLRHFKKDFSLIVGNCRQYNGSENEYTEMAINLKKVFDRAITRYLDLEVSSEGDSSSNLPNLSTSTVYTKRSLSSSSSQNKLLRKSSMKSKSSKFSKKAKEKHYKEDSLKKGSDSQTIKVKRNKKKSKTSKTTISVKQEIEEKKVEKYIKDDAKSVTNLIKSNRKKRINVDKSLKKITKNSSEKEKNENVNISSTKRLNDPRQEKHAKNVIHLSKDFKINRKRKENFEENYDIEVSKSKIKKIENYDTQDSESLITRMKKVKQKQDIFEEKMIADRKRNSSNENNCYKKDKRDVISISCKVKNYEIKCNTKEIEKRRKKGNERLKNIDYKKHGLSKDNEKADSISKKFASLVNNKDLESLDSLKDKISERRKVEKVKFDREKEKNSKADVFILSAKKVPSSCNVFQDSDKIISKPIKSKKVVKDEKLSIVNTNIQYSETNEKKKLKIVHTKHSKHREETPSIQALNQATEQTLNDINKWLDGAPRLTEFSSGSESPMLLPSTSDCSQSAAKLDISRKRLNSIKPFGSHSQLRQKKVQRTIDRLQPGKSKGNLLLKKPTSLTNGNSTDTVINNTMIDIVKPKRESDDEPKLSLGTVLKNTDSIQSFCKNLVCSPNPTLSNEDEEADSLNNSSFPTSIATKEDQVLIANEIVEISSASEILKENVSVINDTQKLKSTTPNLSAWFKAFGAPKSKKKDDEVEESEGNLKKESELTEVGIRQRRMSIGGSSVSESISSFSQESPPARSVQSPQNTQVSITTDSSIRGAGFYQDALNAGTSPYNSPYYATPPRYSAQLPATPSPQNHTLSPIYPSSVTFEQSSFYSQDNHTSYQKPSPQASPNESLPQLSPSFSQNSPQNTSFSQNQSPVYRQQSPQSMNSPYPQTSPQAPTSNYSQSSQQPSTRIYSQTSPQQNSNYSQPSSQTINYSQSSPKQRNSPYSQSSPQPIQNFSKPSAQLQNSPYSQASTPQTKNYSQLSSQSPVSYSKTSQQLPPDYPQLSPQAPASYSQPSSQTHNYSQTSPQQTQNFQNSENTPQLQTIFSQPSQPATYTQTSSQQLSPVYIQQSKQSSTNYSQPSSNQQSNYSFPSSQIAQSVQNSLFSQPSQQQHDATIKSTDQNYSHTSNTYPSNFKHSYLEASTDETDALSDKRRLDFHKEEKLSEQRTFSTQDTAAGLNQNFQSNRFSTYENNFNDRISGQTEIQRSVNQDQLLQHRGTQPQDQAQLLSFQQNLSHETVYQTSFQSSSFPITNTSCRTLYPSSHYFESNVSPKVIVANPGNNLTSTKKKTYSDLTTPNDSARLSQESRQEQFGFDMMPFSESETTTGSQFDSTYSLAESVASNSTYSRLGIGLIGRTSKEQQILTIPRPSKQSDTISYRGSTSINTELDLSILQSLQSATKGSQGMTSVSHREPGTSVTPATNKTKKGRKSKQVAAVTLEQQRNTAMTSFTQYSGNSDSIGLKSSSVVTPGGSAFNFASTTGSANSSPFYDKDTSAAAAAYVFLDEFRNPNSYYSMAFRQQQQQQQQTPPVTDSSQPCNKLSSQQPRNYPTHSFLHTQRSAAYGPPMPTYVTPHGPNLGVDPFQQYLHSFYALQPPPHHHRPSWL